MSSDCQIFGVAIVRTTSFRKPRIYLVIWPVCVIDLAFNVAKNLSKNRRQCRRSVFLLTVVALAIIVIVVGVELDSAFTTVKAN